MQWVRIKYFIAECLGTDVTNIKKLYYEIQTIY